MSYFTEFMIFALLCLAGIWGESIKNKVGHREGATMGERGHRRKDVRSYESQGEQELGRIEQRP